MRQFIIAIAAGAALLGAGCNFHTTTSQSNPDLNAMADANYEDVVAGRDDAVVARLSKENDLAQVRAQLPMLREMNGSATPPEPVVVAVQNTASSQGSFYVVRQDYDYPDRVIHIETRFRDEDRKWVIMGFNLNVTLKAPDRPAAAEAPPPTA